MKYSYSYLSQKHTQSHLSSYGEPQQESLRSTTPKTLVVTLTPDENSPVKLKDFKRAIEEVEGKQKDLCQSQTETFMRVIIFIFFFVQTKFAPIISVSQFYKIGSTDLIYLPGNYNRV